MATKLKIRIPAAASLVGLAVAATAVSLAGCTERSADGTLNAGFFARKTLVSNNDVSNGQGLLETVDAGTFGADSSVQTGGNRGVALDLIENAVHVADAPSAELIFFSKVRARSAGAGFEPSIDGRLQSPALASPKGVALVPSRGTVLVANNRGATPGNILGFGLAARGPAGAAFALPDLSANPWDLTYDPVADRLFVSLVDGRVAVYDNFFVSAGFSTKAPDRFIEPVDGQTTTVDARGLAYHSALDTLVVTDLGVAGDPSDGALLVIPAASTSDGPTQVGARISGPATRLGDPVDVSLLTDPATGKLDALVAEQQGQRLLRFSSILEASSGNRGPLLATASRAPQSLASFVDRPRRFADGNDLDNIASIGSVMSVIVVSNPSGDSDPAEGLLSQLAPDLSGPAATVTTSFQSGLSAENIAIDNAGTALLVFGSEQNPVTGDGGIAKISALFRSDGAGQDLRPVSPNAFLEGLDDRALTGPQTTLQDPKGIDCSDDRGRLFVGDNGAGQIVVLGNLASGDVAPLFRTTDLGAAGRSPWDLDYDPTRDRLFVATTDGHVLRYDAYLANLEAGLSSGPSAVITPSELGLQVSTNLHGLIYLARSDQLIVSDIGDANDATDGQVLIIDNATLADGLTEVTARLTGPATGLGNPVDLAFDSRNLYVAEKAGGQVLLFLDLLELSGAVDRAPDAAIASPSPESVALLPSLITSVR